MSSDKFEVHYDAEYDVLSIYSKAGRSSHGIEWGPDIDVSFDNKGGLISVTFSHASTFLTNLTERKISTVMLSQITQSKIQIKESKGISYLSFSFKLKNNQEISDVLPIKTLQYYSPISSAR